MVHLYKVHTNFERRALYLLGLVARASTCSDRKEVDRLLSYVAIEAQTSLGYVGKACFLAGMLGGKRGDGTTLRAGSSKSQVDVLLDASALFKKNPKSVPGRDEPAWHSGNHLSKLVGLGPSNGADITAALGVFPEARRSILAVRNFYAHRSHHTLSEVDSVLLAEYSSALVGHPSSGLMQPAPLSPSSFMELWLWNYVDIASVMCGK
jgi:hypothetical protein